MRDRFLAKQWKSYPANPVGYDFFGRVDQVSKLSIFLNREEYSLSERLKLCPVHDENLHLSNEDIVSIVRPNDLIAVKLENKRVVELFFLAPCLRPKEFPRPSAELRNALREWQEFKVKVGQFFLGENFLEVFTPTLVTCPGTEPFLDLFETTFVIGNTKRKYFLPTSPELHLKKALALGFDKIFEVKNCFRNGEVSPLHQPEFIMLEWYRNYSDLGQIKKDILSLLRFLQKDFLASKQIHHLSMADLFKKFCDFDLNPGTCSVDLFALSEKLGLHLNKEHYQDFDDIFYAIFVQVIEPSLKEFEILFLEKYPPSQAALARLTDDGWGDRFEFYLSGVEIANAFHELNDPEIQRMRSEMDIEKKRNLGKTEPLLDEEFFRSLEFGLPPAAGVALGLERLFMTLNGYQDLREFRLFPI